LIPAAAYAANSAYWLIKPFYAPNVVAFGRFYPKIGLGKPGAIAPS
jgi:hypothetical protein